MICSSRNLAVSALVATAVLMAGFGRVADAGPSVAAKTRRLAHQTFYASFDKGLAADYAVGLAAPLASGQAATDRSGHAGAAFRYVRAGKQARLFYDAPGNIHPSRGTCSLWFMPDSDEDKRPYCRPPLIGVATSVEGYWGCLMILGPRIISGKTPIGRCYASLFEGSRALHMVSHKIEGVWRKGQWRHLVWVWDSRMGMKVYDNGRLAASHWGPRYGWAEVPDTPARQFSIGMYNRDFRGAGKPGYLIDEVRLFDAALDASTVRALYADRFDAPVRLEPLPTAATARTLARMGWTGKDRQALTPLRLTSGAPAPTRIRVNALDEALDARRPLSHLSDGLPASGWRHPTYGASSSARVVDLILREPYRFNRMELDVFRRFDGTLLRTSREDTVPPKTRVHVPADRVNWRHSFVGGVSAKVLRLKRDEGRVAEVRLWEVMDYRDPPDIANAVGERVFRPVGVLGERDMQSLAGRMARQSLAAAPTGWSLSGGSAPALAPLALKPLTPVFLISGPVRRDLPAGGVTFRLKLARVPDDAVIRVELRDPIWPTRRLFQGDFRLESGPSGWAELRVDLPDFFVGGRKTDEPFPTKGGKEVIEWYARQPLRLTAALTPSGAMTLEQATLTVHEAERRKAIAEHDREQLPYLREGLADTSEARAYGWHPLAYEKLFFPLYDFNLREPDHPKAKALATRVGLRRDPIKVAMPPAEPGIPRWAVLQLALLKRCRALCHYWIEERELPNGEVGGGLGDDTDFKDDWVNLALISDDDGRIADSIRRLADTAWTRDGMDRGYQLHLRDALHAIEEGADLQPHLLYLYPGNPVYTSRVMEMCQHLWEWMGVIPATGKLHFKSWYVGGKGRFRSDFRYGVDRDVCGYFTMGPAFYVWATGHPRVAGRLVRWCDSWLSYLDEKDKDGKPLGLPEAVEWKTGKVVGRRKHLLRGDRPPRQMLPTFACAYRLTGDGKYLTLHRLALRGMPRNKYRGFGTWVNELARFGDDEDRKLIRKVALKLAYRRVADVKSISRDPHYVLAQFMPQHLAWKTTGDKSYLEVALACSLAFLDDQYPSMTWALPSTDRIPQPRDTLDRMYLGGLATRRPGTVPPYPEHAVSYRGIGEEVAALVTANMPDRMSVVFYNTDTKPREVKMRLWQIRRGVFTVSRGPDANADDRIDAGAATVEESSLARGDSVRATLPARSGYVVDLKLKRSLDAPKAQPDLAVCASDVQTDLNAGHATIMIHNIGLAPAENVVVRLVDARTGVTMVQQTIPRLDPPLDLKPRFVRLQFLNVDTAPNGRVRVQVDPGNKIAEADERNNSVEFAF